MGCCQSDAVKTVESSRAPSEVPKNVHHSVVHHGTSQEPVVLGFQQHLHLLASMKLTFDYRR